MTGADAFAICADGDRGAALVLGGVTEELAEVRVCVLCLSVRHPKNTCTQEITQHNPPSAYHQHARKVALRDTTVPSLPYTTTKQAPVRYVPMLPPFAHYWIGVRDLRVNGSSLLPLRDGCDGTAATACASRAVANDTSWETPEDVWGKAMVDTGNSAACLPEAVFDALRRKLEAAAPDVAAIADAKGGRTVFDGYGRRYVCSFSLACLCVCLCLGFFAWFDGGKEGEWGSSGLLHDDDHDDEVSAGIHIHIYHLIPSAFPLQNTHLTSLTGFPDTLKHTG